MRSSKQHALKFVWLWCFELWTKKRLFN